MHAAIDDAIDTLLAVDPTWSKGQAADIATVLGWSVPQTSIALQVHRKAQALGHTRHVLACEGYGRSAMWRLNARHASNAAKYRHLTEGHITHVATDAANRVVSDLLTEIDPAADRMPAAQRAAIMGLVNTVAGTFKASVAMVLATIAATYALADISDVAEESDYSAQTLVSTNSNNSTP